MKVVIIHGQSHKGSTYHIARALAEKTGGEIAEYFLPRDFGEFCVGCGTCFMDSEENCPHHEKIAPITAALDEADVIILASPVYVYHATGAMKALLDHYGYRWMVHRPEEAMFAKQGVCISTAAGAGMRSTMKDMYDSLSFWGVAGTYKCGFAVAAASWDEVSDTKRQKIDRELTALAKKLVERNGKIKPRLKTKMLFLIMRMMHRKGYNPKDDEYWDQKGWMQGKKPW